MHAVVLEEQLKRRGLRKVKRTILLCVREFALVCVYIIDRK